MKFLNYVSRSALVIVFGFAVLAACAPVGTESPWDMDAISVALQNLVLVLLPPLGALAARWLNTQYQANRTDMLDAFIRTMVFAAEQLKLTEAIDDKLDWVTFMVQSWLNARGWKMNAEEIRARIEAAVKENLPKPPAMG